IALSFARIHRQNLIAQGIPPLAFEDPTARELARVGDTWEIAGLRAALARNEERIRVRLPAQERTITVLARFSPRERAVLLAGGLIAWLRAGGARPLGITAGHSAAADQGSPITTPVPD